MAEARPYWTGYIRLSLVTFPVRLYAAVTSTKKIKLHKLSRNSGERIHYKDTTESEGAVEKENIVKGYEYEKGQYVEIEDAELKKLRAQSRKTIDLVQFTDLSDIDPIYFDKPYFVAPDGEIAFEAYVTLRDSLRNTHKVALGQIVIGGHERIAAIKACHNGLLMETLRYGYEVRDASKYFDDVSDDIRVDKDQLKLAEQLIEAKTSKFDPRDFKDTYQEGLMEIIKAKLAHRPVHLPAEEEEPGKVVDIMDALKRSLAEAHHRKQKPKKAPSRKSKSHVA
jgi:DNA end-binding protein Ku